MKRKTKSFYSPEEAAALKAERDRRDALVLAVLKQHANERNRVKLGQKQIAPLVNLTESQVHFARERLVKAKKLRKIGFSQPLYLEILDV